MQLVINIFNTVIISFLSIEFFLLGILIAFIAVRWQWVNENRERFYHYRNMLRNLLIVLGINIILALMTIFV